MEICPEERAPNLRTFRSRSMVNRSAREEQLLAPEQTILDFLRPRLHRLRMLDLGVGAGRTAQHFAGLAARYVGVDYSPEMIRACRGRFRHRIPQATFLEGDARRLDRFADRSFDFILFSFNGIDYADPEGRREILREVSRLCAEGGYFAFSSHNLNYFRNLFSLSSPVFPNTLASRLKKSLKYPVIRLLNEPPGSLMQRDWAVVNDGAACFRLRTYYVKPNHQLSQLEANGFSRFRIFGLDGREIPEAEAFDCTEFYLHYLARKGDDRASGAGWPD